MASKVPYAALDPGIRDVVRLLNDNGFETTDSGDGVSKPAAGIVFPFPHVAAVTTPGTMVADAERCAALLGPEWIVEASYATRAQQSEGTALIFARQERAR